MEIDKIYLKFDFIIQIFAFRGTIMVLGAFLDSFQKIADAATNTKGKRNIHIIHYSIHSMRSVNNFLLRSRIEQQLCVASRPFNYSFPG